MVLTRRYLNQLAGKIDLPAKLTPEQTAILICWYGAKSGSNWTDEDFISGINKVMAFYPDHRKNPYYLISRDYPNSKVLVYDVGDVW